MDRTNAILIMSYTILMLFIIPISLFSQTHSSEPSEQPDNTPTTNTPESIDPAKTVEGSNKEYSRNSAVPKPEDYVATQDIRDEKRGSSDIYFSLIQTVIFLLVFVIIVWIVVRFIKKRRGVTFYDNDSIKVLATTNVALQKYVQLVEIKGKVFVIGVTEHSVNPIGEITEKELVDELKMEASTSTMPNYKQSFSSVMSNILGKQSSAGGKTAANSKGLFSFLNTQKSRLGSLKVSR